jgi:hypothetical protein
MQQVHVLQPMPFGLSMLALCRYAANVSKNPEDHDALYNWALVLQESADNAGSEMDSMSKDALLDEACKKYEAATQLCPTLHEVNNRT